MTLYAKCLLACSSGLPRSSSNVIATHWHCPVKQTVNGLHINHLNSCAKYVARAIDHRSMYPRLPRLVNYCGLKIDLWRVICKLAFSEGAMSAEDQHNLGLDQHALHWISVKHDFVHLLLSSTFHCWLLSNQLAKSNNELKRRNTACTQDNCSAKKLSHTLRRYNLRSLVQLSTCCV